MLYTMPDLTWAVYVKNLVLVYRFSQKGTVTREDPFVHVKVSGVWKIGNGVMTITWGDKTTDEWDVPMNPRRTTGERRSAKETVPLTAEALDYFLQLGDVAYGVGDPIQHAGGLVASVVYENEVRTGGTIAWVCCNPGNIVNGEKYGSIPGKRLHVKIRQKGKDDQWHLKDHPFSIFPNEDVGFKAVVSWMRNYGKRSIRSAMHDYAPLGDSTNNPDAYAARLAHALKVSVETSMASLTDEQLVQLAKAVTGVEQTVPGRKWSRGSPDMPAALRARLAPQSMPQPTRPRGYFIHNPASSEMA